MAVIGMNFIRMEAKRGKGTPRGEIKVNSTPKVTDVKEVNVQNIQKKALSLRFEFLTEYEPDIGTVTIEGTILYLADDNKDVLDRWGKDKSLPEEVSVHVLNHLFRRCLIKISNMAEDLQLPPPIQIPVVKAKE